MIDDDTPDPKRLADVGATLALKGYEVHELPSGGYLVHGGCRHRHCTDFAALVVYARQLSQECYQ